MAFSLNRAQLIGNLTRDPEIRQTGTGQTVCSFSVATNRSWNDSSGQRQEKSDFHNIVAWGKLAEICGQYMAKGRKVYVEGRIQTRDWDGEDGVKRYRTEIVAENVILLDRSGNPVAGQGDQISDQGDAPFERKANSSALKNEAPAPLAEEEVSIDDLPF